MKILAFDGTAKIASVAVLENDRILSHLSVDNGLTQSELLLPMAEDMLKLLKLTFDDIDIFATAVGPGSFTGVRIGVSLVKGLAFGRGVPCVAVSTLEVIAENLSGIRGIIVPVMDARRNQVYNAIFRCNGEGIERLTEDRAIAISELENELKGYEGEPIYLAGDGYGIVKKALEKSDLKIEKTPELLIGASGVSVGLLARKQYLSGNYTSDIELSPVYLRLPQAERERLEREKQKGEN